MNGVMESVLRLPERKMVLSEGTLFRATNFALSGHARVGVVTVTW